MAEEAFVPSLCVFSCTSEPCRDGGLSGAQDPLCSPKISPFGQRGQHHGDLVGRGFQMRQRRVASSTEGGSAGLTTNRLDALGLAMLAIADESVELSIGDPEVRALRVRTSEAVRG